MPFILSEADLFNDKISSRSSLVEQLSDAQKVAGSIPAGMTRIYFKSIMTFWYRRIGLHRLLIEGLRVRVPSIDRKIHCSSMVEFLSSSFFILRVIFSPCRITASSSDFQSDNGGFDSPRGDFMSLRNK